MDFNGAQNDDDADGGIDVADCKFLHDLVAEEEVLFAALNEDMSTHMYQIAAVDEAGANNTLIKLLLPKGSEKQAPGGPAMLGVGAMALS